MRVDKGKSPHGKFARECVTGPIAQAPAAERAKFNRFLFFYFFFPITFRSVMDRKTPELRPAINEYFKDPSPSSNLFDDISSHAAADNRREEPAVCRIFQQMDTKKTDIFDVIKPADADGRGNSPAFDVR